MRRWESVEAVKMAPGGEELRLRRRGGEFRIDIDGSLLMDSTAHSSEEALADIACARLFGLPRPAVLVGGLGMGFTLAAALRRLGSGARVCVSELVPAVVDWNRGPLSHLAGHPLRDARVSVEVGDVAELLRARRGAFDGILQDVDNGPRALSRGRNAWIYSDEGLRAAREALKPGGLLAFWAAKADRGFLKSLRRAGFDAEEVPVRSRGGGRGAHYFVWTALRRGT